MKTVLNHMIKTAFVLCLLAASAAHANISSIQGSSSPQVLLANVNNTVHLRWQVSTTPGYIGAISSFTGAAIYDPANTGSPLLVVGGACRKPEAGPSCYLKASTFQEHR